MKLQKQITNEELLELTRKAFENDEVAEFLCGEKDIQLWETGIYLLIFLQISDALQKKEYMSYI